MRFRALTVLSAFGAGVASLVLAANAAAAAPGTVQSTPASYTPWLLQTTPKQVVEQIAQCNSTMYAVGTLSKIGQGSSTYTRNGAFSFSPTTGAVSSWNPNVTGTVRSIAFSPDCSIAYLGGAFSKIGGVSATNIAAVSTSTGALVSGFAHSANSTVQTLQYTHGIVFAGGAFSTINGSARTTMASLNPTTGAATSYLNLPVSGSYTGGKSSMYNSQVSHDGSRMLIEGTFKSIGGQARQQVAVLDLGSSSASVDGWTAPEFTAGCMFDAFYARAAAWSPDDSNIYVVTTGYRQTGSVPPPTPGQRPGPSDQYPLVGPCDAAIAFPSTPTSVTAAWHNYAGCDSMYAVAADSNNVYISGHERWADQTSGCDMADPGAVSRPGIGSINPTTGKATSWNPTRARGYGSHDLFLSSTGLWVASDNFSDGSAQTCGGQGKHGGICYFPY